MANIARVVQTEIQVDGETIPAMVFAAAFDPQEVWVYMAGKQFTLRAHDLLDVLLPPNSEEDDDQVPANP